jgi:hypothetical protein
MAYGLKISKPGVDVDSATNVQTVFNSENNTFKIFMGATTTSATSFAHGLSYPPAFMYFVKSGTNWTCGAPGYGGEKEALVSVDSTNVYTHTATELYIILFINPLNE